MAVLCLCAYTPHEAYVHMFNGNNHCNLILSNKGVKLLWLLYNNQIIAVNKQFNWLQ